MEPGKAYVKGYEYETIGVEYVDVKKEEEPILLLDNLSIQTWEIV